VGYVALRNDQLQCRLAVISFILNITDLGEPDFKKLNIQWFNFGTITTY
jgi:hypothetical protein